jgi:hypothetical protein
MDNGKELLSVLAKWDINEYNIEKLWRNISMKKYYLSTRADRIVGILFSILMAAVLCFLVYHLRSSVSLALAVGLSAVLIIFILALYVLNVGRAACIVDREDQSIRVTGVRERRIDLKKVACLETIAIKSGNVQGRSLRFSDAEGNTVSIVPTYFTFKQGLQAEPMAKELAKELNVEFRANVPEWYYDKEARKIHDEEVARQEKEEAKQHRKARIAYRAQQLRKRMNNDRKEQ